MHARRGIEKLGVARRRVSPAVKYTRYFIAVFVARLTIPRLVN